MYRFLERVWRLVVDDRTGNISHRLSDSAGTTESTLLRALHATVKKVTEDTEGMRFNTAIAQMMIFVNEATAAATLPRELVHAFLRVLAPYAPHLSEELWARLGETELIATAPWPVHDEALCLEEAITVVVQVNGKRRDRIVVPRDIAPQALRELALNAPGAERSLQGRSPRRVVVVPGRLVNIVI